MKGDKTNVEKKNALGYKHTKEWKIESGKRHKGIKFSDKAKKKLSKSLSGRKLSKSHIENRTKAQRGLKRSVDTRKKISNAKKGNKAYQWKGGISKENKRIRNGIDFRLWREAVFARDNWTCQKTLERGGMLESHHIKNFADYPELRFAIDNGITLSKKSHKEFHKKYGYKNNDGEQIINFLNKDVK